MSVLKNFKNTPRSPPIGRQALSVIFFQIRNEVPGQKNCKGPVAPPRATTGPRPQARQGGLSPPRATGVPTPIYASDPILSSFEPENSTKNPEKKRVVRRREAAKPCRIQHL